MARNIYYVAAYLNNIDKGVKMNYRIIIEDDKGLHQAILNETEEAKEVIHNLNNILKMSDITDYICVFDIKNAYGCDLSFCGNEEKLAMMYDQITKSFISVEPGIISRVISAWDNWIGDANDKI